MVGKLHKNYLMDGPHSVICGHTHRSLYNLGTSQSKDNVCTFPSILLTMVLSSSFYTLPLLISYEVLGYRLLDVFIMTYLYDNLPPVRVEI